MVLQEFVESGGAIWKVQKCLFAQRQNDHPSPPSLKMAPKGRKEDWESLDTNADARLPAVHSVVFVINAVLLTGAPSCEAPLPLTQNTSHAL